MNNALDQAPEHVKLAVDLIMLLEQHQLDTETVLRALKIVQRDFTKKKAGFGWQPHQPHPGTYVINCGCFLPDLTRFEY